MGQLPAQIKTVISSEIQFYRFTSDENISTFSANPTTSWNANKLRRHLSIVANHVNRLISPFETWSIMKSAQRCSNELCCWCWFFICYRRAHVSQMSIGALLFHTFFVCAIAKKVMHARAFTTASYGIRAQRLFWLNILLTYALNWQSTPQIQRQNKRFISIYYNESEGIG